MALSGEFSNYPVSQFGLYCTWSGAQSASGNYTNVTLNVYLRCYSIEVGARTDGTININGSETTFSTLPMYDYSTKSWHNVLLTSKTVKVVHNANGTKTGVTLSASWRFSGTYSNVSVGRITASTTIDLNTITTYTLSVSAGSGSSITVNRTSSGYAGTGNISNGTRLYSGDKLKITFTPNANYEIVNHTVNNSTFTSGNTHTVSGNVSVASTARVLASSVGASDANIESVSTITVTKYNSTYYHSLAYSFEGISGYITKNGGVSATEVKFSESSVAFTVPQSFYARIPNKPSAKCTITCRTYSSSSSTTVLGSATTCQFTATASKASSSPTLSCSVKDTNNTTKALTGDENVLIRYKSNALCSMTATPKNSATISSAKIGGNSVSLSASGGSMTGQRSFNNVIDESFVFSVTDSRGYPTESKIQPTIVKYVQLTINPSVYRPSPTGSSIVMEFSGNFYKGSLGAYTNTLTIRYRYKESGTGAFTNNWVTVPSTSYVTKTTGGFATTSAISLGNDFDYRKSYEFQIEASDGANGYVLSTATEPVTVKRGIPMFDWGENDFNFHTPIKIGDTMLTEEQLQRLLALIS